ncbi:MAG: 50S ribosomal protein L10 [Candidatus Altiarchaeota archaeon]|nr:50S ribosomal protein L10 [Candidatus Altiarchaeota archaeon]
MGKTERTKFAKKLAEEFKSVKTLAVANVGRLPSRQFQIIRRALRDTSKIKFMKKTALAHALKNAKIDFDGELYKTAVIQSELDAFELFSTLKKLRVKIFAKPGMVALDDILVRAGGTGLPPGPDIGVLQDAGLPSKIEKGQIVVIKDHIILKRGNEVTKKIADALSKLDIRPFEVGLEIQAAFEGGMKFTKDVLDIDIDQIRKDMSTVASEAFRMAYNISYPIPEIVEMKVQQAGSEASTLALKLEWVTKDTASTLMTRANAQAQSLMKKVGGK